MKIQCINQGNFTNLTLNKIYDVVSTTRDFYVVLNDVGIEANYHKKYFEEYQEKPQVLTPTFRAIRDGSNITLTITHGLENSPQTSNAIFSVTSVSASCGVISLHGLNNLHDILNNLGILSAENYTAAINKLLRVTQTLYKAIVLFSTNSDNRQIAIDVMNSMANFSSELRRNPNSGNMIKVWGFYVSDNVNQESEIENDDDEDNNDDF